MNVSDILDQTGAVGAIARDLGIDQQTARSGAEALLPSILGGFKNQAKQGGGLGGLVDILGGLGGGGLLDSVTSSSPTPVQPGNEVLGQIFGSKDVSRTVAGQAAQQTGLDSALLKKMLPLLAMAVTGYLSRQVGTGGAGGATSGGGLGDLIGGMLGGSGRQARPAQGGLGGLGSMLDFDGDGNPLNDLLGMAGKLGR